MGGTEHNEASFEALRNLADARFYKWCSKKWRPEWDRRLDELSKEEVTGGRFVSALRLAEELLTCKAREQISIYEGVARERQSREMLSKLRLDEFRQRIMGTSVGASVGALRGRFQRQVNAVGCPPSAVPHERRYEYLLDKILGVVNNELRLLEAEGSDLRDAASNPAESAKKPELTASTEPWNVRLSAARKYAKLSRPAVALKLKAGDGAVTAEAIKKHEEGKSKPKPATRRAYAKIYKAAEQTIFPAESFPPET
jgi:hypothetical protein